MADNRDGRDEWRGSQGGRDDDRNFTGYRDRGDTNYFDESYGEQQGDRGMLGGAAPDNRQHGPGAAWGGGDRDHSQDLSRIAYGHDDGRRHADRPRGGMGGRDRDERSGGQGWFERAANTVGSWVGGDDDHQRSSGRPQERGYGAQGGQGGFGQAAYGDRQSGFGPGASQGRHDMSGTFGGQGGLMGGGYAGSQSNYRDQQQGAAGAGYGAFGQGGFDQSSRGYGGAQGLSGSGGGQHRDEHYHSLRERHLEDFDRQYDEFRKHRHDRFSAEFEEWRRNRGGAGSSSYEQANNPAPSGEQGAGGSPVSANSTGDAGGTSDIKGTRPTNADPNKPGGTK